MQMQPFQSSPQAPVSVRRELPGSIKAVLVLKTLACLATLGVSLAVFMAFSDPQNRPIGMPTETVHHLANLAALASAVSLLELLGVAGTWAFKRWGVYVLAGFTMLNFVIRAHNNDTFGATTGVLSTLVAAAVIATRWNDFE
jgi:hypothetical protein